MSLRFDFAGRLEKAQRTPQGGYRIPAYVTRTGVFVYRTPSGKTVRELRHPDQVFAEDSLSTLEDAVLTVRHPGKVTPKDFRANTVGHTRNPKRSENFVEAVAIVQDAEACAGVERGDLVEVSCGYSCDIDPTPGEYEGEKYDCAQTNIRYNHVALGPRGWGRAGNRVSLRLDSDDAIQDVGDDIPIVETRNDKRDIQMLVTIDGKPYTVGTPEHAAALQAFADKQAARADAAGAKIAAEKSRADEAEGKLATAEKALADATDPARMDAAVDARIALHADARAILGADADLAGKSDIEVMTLAVAKVDPSFKADANTSADYLRGRFSQLKATPVRNDSVAGVRAAARAAEGATNEKKTPAQIRADQRQAAQDAWKKPLAFSKK